MPFHDNATDVIPSGFDAATFLKLAQDPVGFQKKLDELNAAADKARDAQAANQAAYELVGKASEITALRAEAGELHQKAEQHLVEAKEKADAYRADRLKEIEEHKRVTEAHLDSQHEQLSHRVLELNAREATLIDGETRLVANMNAAAEAKLKYEQAAANAVVAADASEQERLRLIGRQKTINEALTIFVQSVGEP